MVRVNWARNAAGVRAFVELGSDGDVWATVQGVRFDLAGALYLRGYRGPELGFYQPGLTVQEGRPESGDMAELRDMAVADDVLVYCLRVADRFAEVKRKELGY